jgi:ribosomal protein L15
MFLEFHFQFVKKSNAAQWKRVASDALDALLSTLAESDFDDHTQEAHITHAITQCKKMILHCTKIQHSDVEVKF